jgi:hypothetical protein
MGKTSGHRLLNTLSHLFGRHHTSPESRSFALSTAVRESSTAAPQPMGSVTKQVRGPTLLPAGTRTRPFRRFRANLYYITILHIIQYLLDLSGRIQYNSECAGCGAGGSARRLGRRGRRFKSYHPDLHVSGSSLVGKASAFQAEDREFESRLPLLESGPIAQRQSHRLITGWSQVRILVGPPYLQHWKALLATEKGCLLYWTEGGLDGRH